MPTSHNLVFSLKFRSSKAESCFLALISHRVFLKQAYSFFQEIAPCHDLILR